VGQIKGLEEWGTFGGKHQSERQYWKFRMGRAEAVFNIVRRLTRLPPQAKRKVVIGQLLPTLTYGSELHHEPTEETSRLAAKFARWVAMGYQGSSRQKIEDITGIGQLEVLTQRKRLRWAASVYARHEPELRPRAERILREELGEDVILKWMEGESRGDTMEMILREELGEDVQ